MDEFRGLARLPKFAVPKRYDLTLKPDLVTCKFSGEVRITLDIVEKTKYIVLNAADLLIRHASFYASPSQQGVSPSNITLVEEDEILVLEFDYLIPINGEKKNMAVTQFEPADARRCFPCWDEPAVKATFKVTLEVPSELIALSNMPVLQEKHDGPLKIVYFEESPIMSTYLVAVVVGLFDYMEGKTLNGTCVRVYCQVGKTDQGKFALDVAVKALDLYKKYFAEPYPLPKLDMIAIPDFAAGAMENYGLVTYRETALLYDERNSAAANKQRVAIVVAHELAHQWFGNLVTMEWWTHLWLNEGFATWVSYLAVDSLFPDWNIWTQFLDETTGGLRLDGLAESHPIEVEINHAREVDEIFDAISYKKGASVIRMLQAYLGAETVQRSLASYIKRHAYKNAKTEDLWAVLSEESGEPVNMLMDSWTKQKGYPVIYAKLEDHRLEFEQSHFLSSGLTGDGQWIVPITLCYGSYNTRKNFLLKSKVGDMGLSELLHESNFGLMGKRTRSDTSGDWIKLNIDQAGFYRVKYDDELASRIRRAIETNSLSATDRFGVLDDAYALCAACKQTLSSLLSLMVAYREELDYTVLSCLIDVSYKVVQMAGDAIPSVSNDLKQFIINLLQFGAEKLGWEPISGESHLDAMLRGQILTALAVFGHEIALSEAINRFNMFVHDGNTPLLPADTRKAAYVAVMQRVSTSNRSGYESLLRIYRETDLSQEKSRILSSLASCPDPEIVQEALNFLLTSEVRSQDVVYGLAGISTEGRDVAWKWLQDNWDFISKTWGSGFLVTRFISAVVSQFSSNERAEEVEAFFSSRIKPSIERTVKQSVEHIRINAQWVKSIKNEPSLEAVVKELTYRKY
ncbi:hypothetical protein AMTR_s00005p00250950 [Amborella trichopoda]|uniref:Aminopeptidase n=1 Tax=Amborella trichopoda TaxID=13333 RepID=W1PG04_AMBTC|nr:hypothetical protein AMTR_s00005p00250950 [Amborella trichopoda]